ncbi:DUF4238 domain-containing protein [Hymenobacter setariae]|uniref:DUF4238 domain-containing protein n=1 Tax=Hymenobacter setariae TaxID=2594794 RepID=A0A558BQ09_9BACT|nr:DUF4238 domain-containing protein [Hymenobacter setariae]TVT38609.1 DUF4238 domain-containing protein [Hymenobacter setariae]
MKLKEHHYVPKFFLRRFSLQSNGKTVGVFNVAKQQFIAHGPLKSQACKPYLYGEDGELETMLSRMEGLAAELLRKMCDTSYVPTKGSDDWVTLLVFALTSDLRTLVNTNKMVTMMDQMHDFAFGDQVELPKNADELKLDHKEAPHIAMTLLKRAFFCCYDLRAVLLKNNTSYPFITCDNPLVKYNQYLEKRNKHGGTVGHAQIGLQLFMPLDPTTMLLLYDPWVYKVGGKGASLVTTINEQDVEALNLLSVVNCDKVLYFNQQATKESLNRLAIKATRYPGANIPVTVKYYADPASARKGSTKFGLDKPTELGDELLHSYMPPPRTNLTLSFISLTKQARKLPPHVASFQKRKSCALPDEASGKPFVAEY